MSIIENEFSPYFLVDTGKKKAKKGGGGGRKKQKGEERATNVSGTHGGGIGGRGEKDAYLEKVMNTLTSVTAHVSAQLNTIDSKFSDMEGRLASMEKGKRTNGAQSDDDSTTSSNSVQFMGTKKGGPAKNRPVDASPQWERFQRTGWSGPIDVKRQRGPWKGQREIEMKIEAQKKVVKELTSKWASEKEEQEKR